MWAVNKQYFYRGDLVFQAKGANLYDSATITIMPGFENLELIPIDVKKMIERNRDIMFLLESEALEFIRETFFIYSTASKKFNEIKANQLDFEAIVASIEQKQKRKMAIIKEECDSFDVIPWILQSNKVNNGCLPPKSMFSWHHFQVAKIHKSFLTFAQEPYLPMFSR